MIELTLATVTLLADPANQTGPDFGKASPVGLLIVVLLFIGICGLVWSMNRHLKRLPDTFDKSEPAAESESPVKAVKTAAGAGGDQGSGESPDESSG